MVLVQSLVGLEPADVLTGCTTNQLLNINFQLKFETNLCALTYAT